MSTHDRRNRRRRRLGLVGVGAGDGGGLDGFVLPQRGDLFGWSAAESFSTTPLRTNRSTALSMGYVALSSSAINGYQTFYALLDAGTYSFTIVHLTSNNSGVLTVSVDGVAIGSFDMYSAVTTDNVVATITGVAVSAGRHTIQTQCLSKHASSSTYQQNLVSITPTRTGV